MIGIIDYGLGNLGSVKNALDRLGYKSFVSPDPEKILQADKAVLPGVGAFVDGIRNLRRQGFDQGLRELCRRGIPLLGICLGMQLLFTESYENGVYQGLGLIEGKVERFPSLLGLKVPHMGWNDIRVVKEDRLFKGIPSGSYCYFVHSYYVAPEDPSCIAATAVYGVPFCAAVEKGPIHATQFHPEKSSAIGLKILKNFGEM